jgi:PAS domain S-box-containing protein
MKPRDKKLLDFSDLCNYTTDTSILKHVLDSMSDSLIVLSQDGDILYSNRMTEQVLGYSFEELDKKGIGPLFFTVEENYDFIQIFIDAISERSVNHYREVDYHHPDGSLRRLACTTSYLVIDGDEQTPVVGFVALFKDITEVFNLRLLEKKLIEEKVLSFNKLAMGVAHEIRNPVVTIGGFASRILKEIGSPRETKQYAQNILEDARRLERVVQDVQNYCDIPEVNLSREDISAAVHQALRDIMPKAQQRNITLNFSSHIPQDVLTTFDTSLMKMAVVSLLDNSIDFSPDGKSVDVAVGMTRDGVTIEITDYGFGISPNDRQFIFDPFFSTKTHGSGMGLAIVDRIVREHMGRIELDSLPGRGTTIRIILSEFLE